MAKFKVRPKPKTKKQLWVESVRAAYNRLQDRTRGQALDFVANGLGVDSHAEIVDAILLRTNADIRTYQINHEMGGTIHVHLSWDDHSAERKFGYALPRKDAFHRSPSLTDSVILAYLQLCIAAGKFV